MSTQYIFLAILIFLMYSVTLWYSGREGFENAKSVTLEDPQSIYDEVYASIHDILWSPKELIDYQKVSIQDIALAERPTDSVHVIDMACGTAKMACWFSSINAKYTGVDQSDAMLEKARENCSTVTFKKGDIQDIHLFPTKSASTCLLLGFSIYQFENPKILSDNANHWLQPDGIFVVHMVDPDKYDPIMDLSTPFAAFSLQKYSVERQTKSTIYFDKFKYVSDLQKNKDEDNAVFHERLVYYDPEDNDGVKYRDQKHHWNMPSKERLISIIQSSGFRHLETVDLVRCGKEYQYLCYFSK